MSTPTGEREVVVVVSIVAVVWNWLAESTLDFITFIKCTANLKSLIHTPPDLCETSRSLAHLFVIALENKQLFPSNIRFENLTNNIQFKNLFSYCFEPICYPYFCCSRNESFFSKIHQQQIFLHGLSLCNMADIFRPGKPD